VMEFAGGLAKDFWRARRIAGDERDYETNIDGFFDWDGGGC
jgi:hypothetical protein